MVGIDDIVEGMVGGTSWGLGFAAVAAAALVGGPRMQPLAKRTIKGYLAFTERGRGWLAEASERMQDLYAEAKHEYESELSRNAASEPVSEPKPARAPARAAAH